MKLISNCQLTGVYGTVGPNQVFNCPDDIAKELMAAGKARKAEPPKIIKETKVIQPPEVGPTVPFRDVPMPDKEPEEVAAQNDKVLSSPDIPKPRTADSGRRRGRLRIAGKRGKRK